MRLDLLRVLFANNTLRKCYEQEKMRVKRWGKKIARRYVERVNILHASKSAQDLYEFPHLRFHPLGGDREGEHALDLDRTWRLILTFADERMTIVRVEEVSDHYGD